VHCPECGAEASALREFCPQCGAPLHSPPRERRPAGPAHRSEDELQRNRKRLLIGGAAVLLVVGIMGKANWFDPDFDIDINPTPKGAAVITAEEIYQAYRDDPRSAAKRFGHREMVVSGEFVRIVPDGQGNPDLRLSTSNPESPLGADLVPISHGMAAQLRPGQKVTVSCQRIAGSGNERWLQNCAIQDAEDGSASPSPPQAPSAPTAPDEGNAA